jgi:putative ABC transport system permease protein
MADGSVNPLLSGLTPEVRRTVLGGGAAVISRDLAKTLNTGVGHRISMPTATGEHSVTVAAVVPYFSALNGAIGISSATMRDWFARDGASTLAVLGAHGADPARLLAEVQRLAPAGVHVYSGAEAVRGFAAALDQATSLDNLIWMIVIVISAVALMNTLLMSVLDRRRELGVLRAVGASRRRAVAMIVAEAAAIGITGGVLGLIFGCVQQVVADLASSRAWNVDVRFEPVPASFALGVGALVLCLLGALPPARRVARMNIIEAIGAD